MALWAQTCDGLGVAYRDRIAGKRSQNLEDAIAWLRRALTVRAEPDKKFPRTAILKQ
jgi:hypothetical protein